MPVRGTTLAMLMLAALLLLLPLRAGAQIARSLAMIKPSVVAIGTFQRTRSPAFKFLATGFAVADGLTIATNAHVVPTTLDSEHFEQLAIAIPAVEGKIEIRSARTKRIDKTHDLAVLEIGGTPLPAARLVGDEPVPEGTEIGFTGFPIGGSLGLTPVSHRGMISAVTPISIPQGNARRLDPRMVRSLAAPFKVYQLDATAYPGNSGSPLYDADSARVVGVINGVFVKGTKENVISEPSGISYAIPVRHLQALLGD